MVTEKQKELLQHMLGADSRYMKKQWGFRNYFCASKGHSDYPELEKMEKLGLVTSRQFEDQVYFYATKKGAVEIDFKPYQLRNAKLAG